MIGIELGTEHVLLELNGADLGVPCLGGVTLTAIWLDGERGGRRLYESTIRSSESEPLSFVAPWSSSQNGQILLPLRTSSVIS